MIGSRSEARTRSCGRSTSRAGWTACRSCRKCFNIAAQRFKVFQRAHKTCDTIAYNWDSPGRKLPDGIHLNLRCDGKAYGGCQAACLIFWKEAWLKPVERTRAAGSSPRDRHGGCSEADVERATRADDPKLGGEPRYSCQATELLNFTTPLPWWDARQYVEDYTLGKCDARPDPARLYLRGLLLRDAGVQAKDLGGRPAGSTIASKPCGAALPYPRHRGTLPDGQPAPTATLNLQPGDFVRVKSYEEILATLNTKNMNRGMAFDGEMMPYCGRTFRVRGRVEKFIDEKTGYMKRMKTPAVILEGAFCRAPLQQSPHVLPALDLFLVARNLVGTRFSWRAADRGQGD